MIYNVFLILVVWIVFFILFNIFLIIMLVYMLSWCDYIFCKLIIIVFVLIMYFNVGLILGYFFMKDLYLINFFWVYVLLLLVSVFNLIVICIYIYMIFESLIEFVKIDGVGDFWIFWKIIFLLCKFVLVIIVFFVVVGVWNFWFDVFLYMLFC